MMKAIILSALLGSATAVSSGVALAAQSELEQIRTQVMAQASDLFKLNAEREGVKHVRSKKATSLMQSSSQVKWEDIEEWKDSGKAIMSDVNLEVIGTKQKAFTAEQFEKELRDLTAATDGSRYIGHPGNKKAAQYIMNACQAAGLEVKEHKFNYGLPNIANLAKKNLIQSLFEKNGNVACYKKGTDPQLSKETIVVGAHYDSVNWRENDPRKGMAPAPGIDDNGSGTAAILMIAKALENHESKRSVLLVAFNAEEEGLLGSKAFVPEVVKSGEYGTLKAAFIADEIAFPGRPNKNIDRTAIFETHEKVKGTDVMLDTMAHQVADPNGEVAGFVVNKHGFGSDHMSFLNAGIPAVLLIERDDEWRADMRGHSQDDTIDDLDMSFGASMARLLYRSAMVMASPK